MQEEVNKSWSDPEAVFVMGKALGSKFTLDDCKRKLFIKSFDGAYGRAGFIITIEGSPIRGMFILNEKPTELLGISQRGSMRIATEGFYGQGNKYMKKTLDYLLKAVSTH